MKIKIIIGCLFVLLAAGCSNFLEESSQDEVRPATVGDMEQVLLGEVYMDATNNDNWGKFLHGYSYILTDDRQCNGPREGMEDTDRSSLESTRYAFSWARDMFDESGGGDDIFLWEELYQRIKGCNVVIDYLDKVTGEELQRENLKGEALTMRAFYYFYLVNFFGLPYNYGNPAENPGVPLKLDMVVRNEFLPRNSVAEVYESILKDLTEGLRLLEMYPIERTWLRAGPLMAKAMLSRVYLYMENWDMAAKYAGEVLEVKPELLDLVKVKRSNYGMQEFEGGVYHQLTPDEIIWARPPKTPNRLVETLSRSTFGVSDELAILFHEEYRYVEGEYSTDFPPVEISPSEDHGDLRVLHYCREGWDASNGYASFIGCIEKDKSNGNQGIRTAEMYLNRAEANIRKFMKDGDSRDREAALADLNELRRHRFNHLLDAYEEVNIIDADALLEFYKKERRKELCDECHHRWFDLRRYGMPQITHRWWVRSGEEQEFVLDTPNKYVLPIPLRVLNANTKLEPNV